jgi:metal-responsive CopG/Arc/MetJ family transcriptional regulator
MDAAETKQVSITLPLTWVKAIDKQTTVLKTRQDLIREWIQPHIQEA